MGLDALLTGKDSISFARRVGTTMFLMPEGLSHYHENMKLYVLLYFILFLIISYFRGNEIMK